MRGMVISQGTTPAKLEKKKKKKEPKKNNKKEEACNRVVSKNDQKTF